MKIVNKKNQISDESLGEANGGAKSWDPGFLKQQKYFLSDEEGEKLGIKSGAYNRNDLANALLQSNKIGEFSSGTLQRLEKQSCSEDMNNILLNDLNLKID